MNCFNITLIGGEPCSGKSTLVKNIIKDKKINKYFEYDKILKGYNNDSFIILGLYEDNNFPGTDRLSMAVQPVFIKFLNNLNSDFNKHIILEGDRLFKTSMIDFLNKFSKIFRLIILDCSEETKKLRLIKRKDNQTDAWLKSKKTTVNNVKSRYKYHLLNNEDKNFIYNLDYVLDLKKDNIIQSKQEFLF